MGLSGGIDSAVVAFLAAEALGSEHVLCLLMPYRTSSPQSRIDAETIISLLNVRHETIDISGIVDAYGATDASMDDRRKGNIMARIRMALLYDRSVKEKAVVFGTGNKSEILLGYSTLHGDTACALNPLGGLYKSEVFRLAHHLGIPERIISKAPSADLWTDQTDESELGYRYEEIDAYFCACIDERRMPSETYADDSRTSLSEDIRNRMAKNLFKQTLPPIFPRDIIRSL